MDRRLTRFTRCMSSLNLDLFNVMIFVIVILYYNNGSYVIKATRVVM